MSLYKLHMSQQYNWTNLIILQTLCKKLSLDPLYCVYCHSLLEKMEMSYLCIDHQADILAGKIHFPAFWIKELLVDIK